MRDLHQAVPSQISYLVRVRMSELLPCSVPLSRHADGFAMLGVGAGSTRGISWVRIRLRLDESTDS